MPVIYRGYWIRTTSYGLGIFHKGRQVHADAISEPVAMAMIDMMIGKLLSVEAETAMKEVGILDTFNNSEVTK